MDVKADPPNRRPGTATLPEVAENSALPQAHHARQAGKTPQSSFRFLVRRQGHGRRTHHVSIVVLKRDGNRCGDGAGVNDGHGGDKVGVIPDESARSRVGRREWRHRFLIWPSGHTLPEYTVSRHGRRQGERSISLTQGPCVMAHLRVICHGPPRKVRRSSTGPGAGRRSER